MATEDVSIPGQPPIFIVGCHRSGTTLFRLILDSHPNISCGPETRFLGEFEHVINDANWPRISLYGFSREWWIARFARFFNEFQTEYATRRGKSRWADKTPLYAKHLDFIDELFPECLVINLVRDGRDVVRSHRDTWGYWSGVKSIAKWPRYIERGERFGARVGPARYLEVRYEHLVADTEGTLRRAMAFIGETWDDALLHHTDHQHDVMELYVKRTSARREAFGDRSAVFVGRVGGGRRHNDPVIRLLLRIQAGRTLRRLGYE
jgi:hypothetical protein